MIELADQWEDPPNNISRFNWCVMRQISTLMDSSRPPVSMGVVPSIPSVFGTDTRPEPTNTYAPASNNYNVQFTVFKQDKDCNTIEAAIRGQNEKPSKKPYPSKKPWKDHDAEARLVATELRSRLSESKLELEVDPAPGQKRCSTSTIPKTVNGCTLIRLTPASVCLDVAVRHRGVAVAAWEVHSSGHTLRDAVRMIAASGQASLLSLLAVSDCPITTPFLLGFTGFDRCCYIFSMRIEASIISGELKIVMRMGLEKAFDAAHQAAAYDYFATRLKSVVATPVQPRVPRFPVDERFFKVAHVEFSERPCE